MQEDTQTQQSCSPLLNLVMSWSQVLILCSGRSSKVVFVSWWLTDSTNSYSPKRSSLLFWNDSFWLWDLSRTSFVHIFQMYHRICWLPPVDLRHSLSASDNCSTWLVNRISCAHNEGQEEIGAVIFCQEENAVVIIYLRTLVFFWRNWIYGLTGIWAWVLYALNLYHHHSQNISVRPLLYTETALISPAREDLGSVCKEISCLCNAKVAEQSITCPHRRLCAALEHFSHYYHSEHSLLSGYLSFDQKEFFLWNCIMSYGIL